MIRVNKDYVIQADTFGYTVQKDMHKKDAKGNEVYSNVGYYSTLDSAVKGIVRAMDLSELDSRVFDLKEAAEVIRRNNQSFADMLKVAMGE